MIYLASPYSHPDPAVRRRRYEGACRAVAHLLQKRLWAYSPIAAMHPTAVKYKLPTDHEFWLEYDLEFLKRSDAVYVLELPGWLDSKGIEWETGAAFDRGIPIYQMLPLHNGHYEVIPNP